MYPLIKEEAIAYGIGIVSPSEIDEINILNASFLAMHRAIDQLKQIPDRLLIDGNRFNPYPKIEHHCIIKGDGKYLAIAAASVLAKVYRDEFMSTQHLKYPDYNWNQNNGYPTKKHRFAIKNFGITPLHRKTFNLLGSEQLELQF